MAKIKDKKMYRKIMIILYTVFLFVLSLSLVLMPFGSEIKEESKGLMYTSGACFWIGLLGVAVCAVLTDIFRKGGFSIKKDELKKIGLIRFFKNKEAIAADILMFVSIAGFIIARIFTENLIVLFSLIAVFIFSFGMHSMLNGINYNDMKKDRRGEK